MQTFAAPADDHCSLWLMHKLKSMLSLTGETERSARQQVLIKKALCACPAEVISDFSVAQTLPLEALSAMKGSCSLHVPCSAWASPRCLHKRRLLMCCVFVLHRVVVLSRCSGQTLRAATAAQCTMCVCPAAGRHRPGTPAKWLHPHFTKLLQRAPALLQVGVPQGRLRKWLLSVAGFLRNQNGSVAEAIALWQRNVVKEFEGVEECLICYTIVAASNGKLPKLQCHTCSKRFHAACLYKWFQSSGKSN